MKMKKVGVINCRCPFLLFNNFTLFAETQNKRRSEEPLFKIVHKLVDETDRGSEASDKENIIDNDNHSTTDNEKENIADNVAKEDANDDSSKEEKEELDKKRKKKGRRSKKANFSKVEEEEPEWEVEEIIDYKYFEEKKAGLYFVKWVGWGSESNTWEPEAHVTSCNDLLVNFYNKRLKEREEAGHEEERVLELPPDPREEEEPEWEVEDVVDYQFCKEQQAGLYLVKWIGWGPESNTWEPEAHLQCTDLLVEFYKTRLKERESATPAEKRVLELPPDPRETFQIRQDFLREHVPPVSKKTLEKYFKEDRAKVYHKRAKRLPEKEINRVIDECAKKFSILKLKWIKEQLTIKSMILERESQVQDLRKYEREINEIDKDDAHVFVINEVDLEGPPRQMQYINAYKAGAGISIPDDPFIGCSCECCDWKQKQCCSKTSGDFHFAYNNKKKLRDVIVVRQEINFKYFSCFD